MPPSTVMLIRHAEKPLDDSSRSVDIAGRADRRSLSPLGWQRAGALAQLFGRPWSEPAGPLTPDTIFAAGQGKGSRSRRSVETVTPLHDLLATSRPIELVTRHLEGDHEALVADVSTRTGVVLVAWEHKEIPKIARTIATGASIPHSWPDDRFDLLWTLNRSEAGWTFGQSSQFLLAGDRDIR